MQDLKVPISRILSELIPEHTVLCGEPATAPAISNVTVGEVTDVSSFLTGSELILTTLQAFKDNEKGIDGFIRSLIEQKAAGVFVKLGRFIPQLPDSSLKIARQHNFLVAEVPHSIRWTILIKQILDMAGDSAYRDLIDLDGFRRRLTDTLIYGSGWSSFLAELEALTDTPAAIADRFGNLIARSRNFTETARNGHGASSVQSIEISWRSKPWGMLLYRLIGSAGAFAEAPARSTSGASDAPAASDAQTRRSRDDSLADDSFADDSLADESLLQRLKEAAGIAEVQISRDRVEIETRNLIKDELLTGLRSGGDTAKLERELLNFKFDAFYGFRIAGIKLMPPANSKKDVGELDDLRESLHYMLSSKLDELPLDYFTVNEKQTIYVLMSPSVPRNFVAPEADQRDTGLDALLHQHVDDLLDHINLYIKARFFLPLYSVASAYYADLELSPKAFTEIDHKLEVLELIEKRDLTKSEFEILAFLMNFKYLDTSTLKDASEKILLPVARYDKAHDAELIPTLKEFFSSDENVPATGKAIFAHRHTVRYRLKKIEGLTGLDLKRSADKFRLQLALYAREIS